MELADHSMMIGMELKKRSDMHLARKLWHIIGVGLLAFAYYYLSSFWSEVLFILLWLIAVPMDLLRQKYSGLNDLTIHVFKPIMRESESKGLAGTTYLLSGVLVVYHLFPREIVMTTLLYLAFADPLASIVGIKYGKDKIFGHKSVQGSLAAFIVCTVITYFVLSYKGILMDRILLISLFGGLIGAAAEVVPVWKLDDNFSLPVVSAIGLWILFLFFGGL